MSVSSLSSMLLRAAFSKSIVLCSGDAAFAPRIQQFSKLTTAVQQKVSENMKQQRQVAERIADVKPSVW